MRQVGQARKQAGEASDPRHCHILSESRSPAWASSGPLDGRGVVVLGEGMMGRRGKAWPQRGRLARPCCPPVTTETERDRQTDKTDKPGEGAMRALLAPSRQANRWADRPMVGCSDRQQGTCGQASMSQAGRQAASEEDAAGGCPVRGVASLQLLPAGASVRGLELSLELGVHHAESWPA